MKKFLKETSGSIAVNVALLGIPLMISAGVAIDYSQFARKQSSLQNVTDAAALAAAHTIRDSNQAEVEASVDDFLKSNLSSEQYNEIQNVNVVVGTAKEKIHLQIEGKHPTSLMRIAGIKTLNYKPESVVNIGASNVEIILALDSTGSMSLEGKMDQLKVSANEFVENILASNSTSGQTKIGIVPFAQYVNVGLENRDASWMDVPDDYTGTETKIMQDVISSSGCSDQQVPDVEGILVTQNVCDNIELGPEREEEIVTDFVWAGCAGSRDYPLNLNDEDYNYKVPGILNAYCPSQITEVTSDRDLLKNRIDSLVPAGITYIPSGLTWAYRAITSKAPFETALSEAEAAANSVQKVIVLMSDGENQSSIYPLDKIHHTGTNLVQANQYTREVCQNIKDDGILLYTIGFGRNIPQATLDLLRECSTGGTNYYAAEDGVALTRAFEGITSSLSAFYISR